MTTRHDDALLAAGIETGWWDEHGIPAPWPHDINDRRIQAGQPVTPEPGQPPFYPPTRRTNHYTTTRDLTCREVARRRLTVPT